MMINITVQIDNDTKSTTHLNLEDELSNIRKQLEQNSEVKLNDALFFSKKISQEYALIAREDEGETTLKEIVETKAKILYLKSEPNWIFFNYNCKLEFGYTVALDKSNRKVFKIVDYEMTEIEGSQNDTKEIDSMNLGWIVKTNLLANIQDFAKLGVPIESLKIKKSKFRTNIYNISECSKVSLKFKKLEPTEEFIKAVKIAIESKDLDKFKDITKEFGQFIPKEIILGGRAYFKEQNAVIQTLIINAVNKNFEKNNSKCEGFKLVGGKMFGSKDSNELTWTRSLEDFRNWDCIKFKDPVSIFQPLSEDLRKQILISIGKKILYTNTEDYSYKLSKPETPQTFELKNIPEKILEILRNEDAECNIFATVVCTNKAKGDVFNCQILWQLNEDPRLIIHCIQKKFKRCECKLDISLMIIGYDINFDFNRPNFDVQLKVQKHEFNASNCQTIIKSLDLEYGPSVLCFGIPVLSKMDSSNNSLIVGHHFFKDKENKIGLYPFSYSLKENHYVNLPDFTFYTLIILNRHNSGILPFKHHNFIHQLKFTKPCPLPKYISLYTTGENNCGPILLKQRPNEIKLKYIVTTSCDQVDCICKNNRLKKI